MHIKTLQKLAGESVRVSIRTEQSKRVIGLHGFKSDIEAVLRAIKGYHVEWSDTGAYLYSHRANWN